MSTYIVDYQRLLEVGFHVSNICVELRHVSKHLLSGHENDVFSTMMALRLPFLRCNVILALQQLESLTPMLTLKDDEAFVGNIFDSTAVFCEGLHIDLTQTKILWNVCQ